MGIVSSCILIEKMHCRQCIPTPYLCCNVVKVQDQDLSMNNLPRCNHRKCDSFLLHQRTKNRAEGLSFLLRKSCLCPYNFYNEIKYQISNFYNESNRFSITIFLPCIALIPFGKFYRA